ncbi:MAG: hypothetical protein RQ952_01980 [Thermoproteota archaeon]|nr:hypothetical protein [Thermoproteota archaeon]
MNRKLKKGEYLLEEVFSGLENSWIVKNVLKEKFEEMKRTVKIRIVDCNGYMWVEDSDGSIYICQSYLKKGKLRDLYLDILHELIHVLQWKKGLDLFDRRYSYYERPTEIEAYKYTIEEAKNLGMSKEEMLDYLYVPWETKEKTIEFAKKLNII